MSSDAIPDVERPLFFDGERLAAADLKAAQEYHQQMRWLHNRSLHSWGIVLGLEVSATRGDRELKVQSGFALDCLGRELILGEPAVMPVPPAVGANGQPEAFSLTISYQEDDRLDPSETETGVCGTGGATRLPEVARLRIQSLRDTDPSIAYRSGLDVVLASIRVQNCKLAEPPSAAERRDAQPADRPYVATGLAAPPACRWNALQVAGDTVGLQMAVDTSAAGFGSTPAYTAQVIGERRLADGGGVVDGLADVAGATPTGFTLRFLMPRSLQAGGTALNPASVFVDPVAAIEGLGWSVAWVGIEV
jgi:hypothetical protein